MMKKSAPLIALLTAALITLAAGCGDSGSKSESSVQSSQESSVQSSAESSPVSSQESSQDSSQESSNTQSSPESSDESSQENSKETSQESSKESSQESSKESSQEQSSQTSKEESSADQKSNPAPPVKSERQALQEYADTMQAQGGGPVSTEFTNSPKYAWQINKKIVDDFNHDGSPELVVQYYCGISGSAPNQGVALEIIKYENNSFRSYRTYQQLSEYVRFAGSDPSNFEIVDELYVDENNNLCIYRTNPQGTSSVATVQRIYTIQNQSISLSGSLAISQGIYEGFSSVYDPEHSFYGYDAGIGPETAPLYFFVFSVPESGEHVQYLDKNEALRLHQKFHSYTLLPEFRVTDKVVEQMEKNYGYDISKMTFVSVDLMESTYYHQND